MAAVNAPMVPSNLGSDDHSKDAWVEDSVMWMSKVEWNPVNND
tara:strand:- start:151 stop:279 length:129 start_codon:yes stop_codon:yes gene_type:complete